MRCRSVVAMAALALAPVILAVRANAQGGGLPCDAFVKNADGSWTAIEDAAIQDTGAKLTIRRGSILRAGAAIRNLDLATMLDRECPTTPASVTAPGEPAAPPSSAPPGRAAAAEPRLNLSRYADANGSLEVQTLTCGHLADAPPQEADLFLAFYSGWYNGLAKRRGINLARVRYAIRNILDYCSGNRDKRIVQVMDLMLK